MSTDPRKRQKKLERRAAKRKAKRRQLTRESHTGLSSRLTAAADYPVLHSLATTDLWDEGLGWICLSRQLPNGSVAFGVFLVDRYCLGVKNALADITSRFEYDSQIVRKMRSEFTSKELTPAATRKLVESAVAYAESLGLHPHPDYHKAKLIFGTIDARTCPDEFEFGKDGQPFFVAGPHDIPERCRFILRTLEQHCGADGFHYLIPLADPNEVLPESLKQRPVRMIGPDETGSIVDAPMGFSEEREPDRGP
jgi:hypothetical protein